MAGNKINTKTKVKEDKTKGNKSIIQTNDENEDLDFSILRKPILTSITGFAQARKIFDMATEELKNLLSNECDLLYECKVCRNIFRSLVNFISHKRVFCKDNFNSSLHGQFFKAATAANEMIKIKQLEESYFESLKNKEVIIGFDEPDSRVPLTKDLTAVIEKISTNNKNEEEEGSEDPQVSLQKIPSCSVAVFQTVAGTYEKNDKMRAQVKELDNILSRNNAILQSDGKCIIQSSPTAETDNVIQISDDEDTDGTNNLKCKICEQNFSTQKTLKFHMKYKHLESRLVYPCPDCLEIFSTSWSVYRHLFKVHRKTAAQIRRLRESIQSKAFKMNNPPAFYEKRKNIKPAVQKISEEERLDQENQAWMDNMEGEGEVPRCFGCGRTFERRAALAAHTHTCPPRSRALARRPPDAKKIEIQIRKDYNKGPGTTLNLVKTTDANENKIALEEVLEKKGDDEAPPPPPKKGKSETSDEPTADAVKDDGESTEPDESPEKTAVDREMLTVQKTIVNLPFALQTEKSNLTAFRQKIQPDIEVNKLLCKKCDIQHGTVQELYDHMADHYQWMRYACKLCTFKHYNFDKLPDHVKVVHKLKGDSEFYFSTVKAIDGNEALEMCKKTECAEETLETNDVSPDSRRQSRCSSDSSRLSDDSSSSSTRAETGSRKRKMHYTKSFIKKRKECSTNDDEDKQMADAEKDVDNDSSSKPFDENSSDMDDIEDKISRKTSINKCSSVASRRPVRKKTKPKNEDFEYDLSNLLKMEAQGYRDAQSVTTKTNQTKKKTTQQENQTYYEMLNRECCGALSTLSKKAVETSSAHVKNTDFVVSNVSKDPRTSNIFVRPMLPKIIKGEKNSPKKDMAEELKEYPSPQKEIKVSNCQTSDNTVKELEKKETEVTNKSKNSADSSKPVNSDNVSNEPVKNNINIPAVVPIKFRRQSLEVIKNPLINKNITDFKKAGMKTKILVIKPINRNKDGSPASSTPLKFQTIKLKDPSKSGTSSEAKSSDQVVVVKVPKVECTRVVTDPNVLKIENSIATPGLNEGNTETSKKNVSNSKNDETEIDIKSSVSNPDPETVKDVTGITTNELLNETSTALPEQKKIDSVSGNLNSTVSSQDSIKNIETSTEAVESST